MENDTRLIKVSIPNTNPLKIICRTVFRQNDSDPVPVVGAVLDGIAKQVEVEEGLQKTTNADARLIQAFMSTHITNSLYLGSKKKSIDLNIPSYFHDACEYPG